MAPSMSGEELQQLLFSNDKSDKSFAKDVKHSTANKKDDIENFPTYRYSTKPNLLLPVKTT
ncbi:hypothetical protein MKW92_017330, partial [Papaver armeniacum]